MTILPSTVRTYTPPRKTLVATLPPVNQKGFLNSVNPFNPTQNFGEGGKFAAASKADALNQLLAAFVAREGRQGGGR